MQNIKSFLCIFPQNARTQIREYSTVGILTSLVRQFRFESELARFIIIVFVTSVFDGLFNRIFNKLLNIYRSECDSSHKFKS